MRIRSPYGVSIHWNGSASPGGPARNDTALVLSVTGATETYRLPARSATRPSFLFDHREARLPIECEWRVTSSRAQCDPSPDRDRPRQPARPRLVHVHRSKSACPPGGPPRCSGTARTARPETSSTETPSRTRAEPPELPAVGAVAEARLAPCEIAVRAQPHPRAPERLANGFPVDWSNCSIQSPSSPRRTPIHA